MQKVSHTDIKNVLSLVPSMLRDLNEKCASLSQKVAFYERKERVEKIAQAMEVKSLRPELSYEEKIESLMNSEDDKLNVIEEAVNMQPTQIGFGTLDKQAGNSVDPLFTFIEQLND